MQSIDYTDTLWEFMLKESDSISQGEKPTFLLRPGVDESELYYGTTENHQLKAFEVELPVSESSKRSSLGLITAQQTVGRDEARDIGMKLWSSLPSDIKQSFQVSVQGATKDQAPVRLKICSALSSVTDIPWELLASETGSALSLHPNVRLVRTVPVLIPPPALTVTTPVQVLLLVTNPKDARLLQPYKEIMAIRGGLNFPDYKLRILDVPTLEALQLELNNNPPHIIHYIGRSAVSKGEGNIILHDNQDRTFWLCGSDLARILPPSVRLICLSACYTAENYRAMGLSRIAHSSASFQLPTMIANQYPLGEPSIVAFWNAFYPSLIEHQGNVNEAFHEAQLAACKGGPPDSADWASFVLILRDRTGKALRIVKEETVNDVARLAAELSAQVATDLANILAEQIRALGDNVSSEVRKLYESESDRARWLVNKATNIERD